MAAITTSGADLLTAAKTIYGECVTFFGSWNANVGAWIAYTIAQRIENNPTTSHGTTLAAVCDEAPGGTYEYATRDPVHPDYATYNALTQDSTVMQPAYAFALSPLAALGGVAADIIPTKIDGITHYHTIDIAEPGSYSGYTFKDCIENMAFYAEI